MWTLTNDKHVNWLVAPVELLSASLCFVTEKTTDQHLFYIETANTPLFHERKQRKRIAHTTRRGLLVVFWSSAMETPVSLCDSQREGASHNERTTSSTAPDYQSY